MFNNKDGIQIQFNYCLEQLQKFTEYFLEYKIIHFICLFDKSNYNIKELKHDNEVKNIIGLEYLKLDNRFKFVYVDDTGYNRDKFVRFVYQGSLYNDKLEGYFLNKNEAEIYFKDYLMKLKADKIKELKDTLKKLEE